MLFRKSIAQIQAQFSFVIISHTNLCTITPGYNDDSKYVIYDESKYAICDESKYVIYDVSNNVIYDESKYVIYEESNNVIYDESNNVIYDESKCHLWRIKIRHFYCLAPDVLQKLKMARCMKCFKYI